MTSTAERGGAAPREATLAAKPAPITLDLGKTAILVVDMQNDFGAKGGIFERAGIDISAIQRVVAPTRKVIEAGRAAGVKVVYLKMGFRPDLSDMGAEDAPTRVHHKALGAGKKVQAPNGQPSALLVRDTWNTEILPELTPKPGDTVLWKHRYSGFYGTELDALLKRAGVKSLVVTGCTTSVCVESTVRDAMFRDYSCVLLADCMAEPIGTHEASLTVMQRLFAWVSDSAEFLRALEPVAAGGAARSS